MSASKKGKVFFNPIEGSGCLSISWAPGPMGAATEANNAKGVGFFSPAGDLLGVVFDDVAEKSEAHPAIDALQYFRAY